MKAIVIITMAIIKLSHINYCKAEESSFLTKLAEVSLSEDGRLNFTQLVIKYGQDVEQFDVVTEDGYINTLFHIPGNKSPVLISHGLIDSADSSVIRGHGSLGIALADAGYDVWVNNNRGTRLSRRHVHLNPDTDKKFWDFSFHDMAYDLAAAIDFVRNQTGEEQIFSIGHSQGASQHFPLMSLRPEYNDRIKLFIAMAPGVYFRNMSPSFSLLASLAPIFLERLKTQGHEELFKDRGAAVNLIRTICTKGDVSYTLCVERLIFPIAGFNPAGLEPEFLPTVLGHVPQGASRKCFVHFDQLYFAKDFIQFDYGRTENLVRYGSHNPPQYDLSKVTGKVALLAGVLDQVVLPENVKLLYKNLPNAVHYEEIAATNHNDFVVGKEAGKYLFPSIIKLLQEYENN